MVPTLAQRTFPALRNTVAFPESFSRRILDEEGLARGHTSFLKVPMTQTQCNSAPTRGPSIQTDFSRCIFVKRSTLDHALAYSHFAELYRVCHRKRARQIFHADESRALDHSRAEWCVVECARNTRGSSRKNPFTLQLQDGIIQFKANQSSTRTNRALWITLAE